MTLKRSGFKPRSSRLARGSELKRSPMKRKPDHDPSDPRFLRMRDAVSPLKGRRRKPLAKRNAKRRTSEFARCYGSRARVAWVKAQPCVVGSLGCDGPSQNAHTANGGMGRKADADTIVPMCDGHHRLLHCWGVETFSRSYALDLPALAADTDRRWREHLNRTAA